MVTKQLFDVYDGKEIYKYTIVDEISVSVVTFGARIFSIVVPSKDGKPVDVALNFTNVPDLLEKSSYMGATVGRFANRIGGNSFTLNGKTYELWHKEGRAHQHGGRLGFDKRVFDATCDENSVTMRYVSPDGEENYPATLFLTVKFTVSGGRLSIEYFAESDGDTIFNPTNHCYFNLNGENDGSILDNVLQINADGFLPTDGMQIPTGEIKSVAGTPFDFRTPKPIGRDIDADDADLKIANGFDHTFCIGNSHFATAYSAKTGIRMDAFTDRPGVQFYSGNSLKGFTGKSVYNPRSGFCLETQLFPDCVNKSQFQSPLLKKGEKFYSKTELLFSVQ